MFDAEVKTLVKLFDENSNLELTSDEIEAIGNKKTPLLREGIKLIVTRGNGSIVFTKNLDKGDDISAFLIEIIKNLQFPGDFCFDFAGFLKDSENSDNF